MGWCQKVTPNTNDKTLVCYDANGKAMKDWCGWCLAVTQQAFGITKRLYASAIKAWDANTTKHSDLRFPERVYFPLFWRGGEYGHVAIAYCEGGRIKIWSSPYTKKAYFDYFESTYSPTYSEAISTIERKYGLKEFIGWTETLTGTRLIEWIDDPVLPKPPEPEIIPELEPTPEPEHVEKPVENHEPTDKEPVDKSTDGILSRMLKRLIDWIKSFL